MLGIKITVSSYFMMARRRDLEFCPKSEIFSSYVFGNF